MNAEVVGSSITAKRKSPQQHQHDQQLNPHDNEQYLPLSPIIEKKPKKSRKNSPSPSKLHSQLKEQNQQQNAQKWQMSSQQHHNQSQSQLSPTFRQVIANALANSSTPASQSHQNGFQIKSGGGDLDHILHDFQGGEISPDKKRKRSPLEQQKSSIALSQGGLMTATSQVTNQQRKLKIKPKKYDMIDQSMLAAPIVLINDQVGREKGFKQYMESLGFHGGQSKNFAGSYLKSSPQRKMDPLNHNAIEYKFEHLNSILGNTSVQAYSQIQYHDQQIDPTVIHPPLQLNKQQSFHRKSNSDLNVKKKPTEINLLHFRSLESLKDQNFLTQDPNNQAVILNRNPILKNEDVASQRPMHNKMKSLTKQSVVGQSKMQAKNVSPHGSNDMFWFNGSFKEPKKTTYKLVKGKPPLNPFKQDAAAGGGSNASDPIFEIKTMVDPNEIYKKKENEKPSTSTLPSITINDQLPENLIPQQQEQKQKQVKKIRKGGNIHQASSSQHQPHHEKGNYSASVIITSHANLDTKTETLNISKITEETSQMDPNNSPFPTSQKKPSSKSPMEEFVPQDLDEEKRRIRERYEQIYHKLRTRNLNFDESSLRNSTYNSNGKVFEKNIHSTVNQLTGQRLNELKAMEDRSPFLAGKMSRNKHFVSQSLTMEENVSTGLLLPQIVNSNVMMIQGRQTVNQLTNFVVPPIRVKSPVDKDEPVEEKNQVQQIQAEEDVKKYQHSRKQSQEKKSPKVANTDNSDYTVLKSSLKKAYISKVEEILIDLVQNNEKPGNFLPRPQPKKKVNKQKHQRNNTLQAQQSLPKPPLQPSLITTAFGKGNLISFADYSSVGGTNIRYQMPSNQQVANTGETGGNETVTVIIPKLKIENQTSLPISKNASSDNLSYQNDDFEQSPDKQEGNLINLQPLISELHRYDDEFVQMQSPREGKEKPIDYHKSLTKTSKEDGERDKNQKHANLKLQNLKKEIQQAMLQHEQSSKKQFGVYGGASKSKLQSCSPNKSILAPNPPLKGSTLKVPMQLSKVSSNLSILNKQNPSRINVDASQFFEAETNLLIISTKEFTATEKQDLIQKATRAQYIYDHSNIPKTMIQQLRTVHSFKTLNKDLTTNPTTTNIIQSDYLQAQSLQKKSPVEAIKKIVFQNINQNKKRIGSVDQIDLTPWNEAQNNSGNIGDKGGSPEKNAEFR